MNKSFSFYNPLKLLLQSQWPFLAMVDSIEDSMKLKNWVFPSFFFQFSMLRTFLNRAQFSSQYIGKLSFLKLTTKLTTRYFKFIPFILWILLSKIKLEKLRYYIKTFDEKLQISPNHNECYIFDTFFTTLFHFKPFSTFNQNSILNFRQSNWTIISPESPFYTFSMNSTS